MSDEEPNNDEEQRAAVEVVIEPNQLAGVYANWAQVNHSEHEFTIDFVRLDYANQPPQRGIVVARVAVSALFITQLIDALQANWSRFAAKAMPKEVHEGDGPGEGRSDSEGT